MNSVGRNEILFSILILRDLSARAALQLAGFVFKKQCAAGWTFFMFHLPSHVFEMPSEPAPAMAKEEGFEATEAFSARLIT